MKAEKSNPMWEELAGAFKGFGRGSYCKEMERLAGVDASQGS